MTMLKVAMAAKRSIAVSYFDWGSNPTQGSHRNCIGAVIYTLEGNMVYGVGSERLVNEPKAAYLTFVLTFGPGYGGKEREHHRLDERASYFAQSHPREAELEGRHAPGYRGNRSRRFAEARSLFRRDEAEDVFGSLKYKGKAKTIEEMNAAIEIEVKRRHARGRY